MRRTRRKKACVCGGVFLIFAVWMLWSWTPVTERISLDLVEGREAGMRIVLLTDLHSCRYGKDQKTLIGMVEAARPDAVMLGGDIFDDVLPDDNAGITVRRLAEKYPCFYVTGNHEYWSGRVEEMKAYLKSVGVRVLEGDCATIQIKGCTVDVCGVDDPFSIGEQAWKGQLDAAYAQTGEDHLRILLTHRPEKVDIYEQYDFDLILAGHAHAGQFRIPLWNRGLLAPDQGFFAKYVNGVYELPNGSVMEVSRGLARESTPLPRCFNHPEVVLLEIE